jgi:diaminobutyrate-2-oxoglutarate transaminase
LETFDTAILRPRRLEYKVQFTGPTGANAVEAALKLARKVKQRSNIVCFTNGYHGLSAGALSITGNRHFRNEAFVNRLDATFMPFDGYFGEEVNTLDYLRRFLEDTSSGLDVPAAVILETIQAEGGVNVARSEWLKGLQQICREFDILLIVDDIQVGNGRTGAFFSFESAGIEPDMVVLSKAIGGLGLPMSLLLINPAIDQWKPAEHTGTFRGNNLAFVAATAALEYWKDGRFSDDVQRKGQLLERELKAMQQKHADKVKSVRGRGLIYGLEMAKPELAKSVSRAAFERKLIIELAGAEDQVVKFLPPLVIEDAVLKKGLEIIDQSIAASL